MTIPQSLERYSDAERALRLDLAACYRIFALLGWTDMIFNHITVRVPGAERHYLINPFGMHYEEITASSLVKLDLDGNVIERGSYGANRAGFIIHSAIHQHRPDAHCIAHTHTREGVAVAGKKDGLSHDTFYGAALTGAVAYHDFEGITIDADEQPRIVSSLGTKNMLILRNHGILACGNDIPQCFWWMWYLQRACEDQCAVDSLRGENLQLSAEVREATRRRREERPVDPAQPRMIFEAMKRRVERRLTSDNDYRI
jgi:ribulose-5-phosphate 4-epimerase/fuculose-1-phosphate aldolase